MMGSRWIIKYGYLQFLSLLLLYVVMAITLSSETLTGDEGSYIEIANRLAGHSSATDNISLWRGPGYPMVLVPFVSLKLPWLGAKLLNALFLFIAVVYFYNTLTFWLHRTYATIFAYILGLYPPFIREVHLLLTENLVLLIICGFMFHFCKVFRESKRPWLHLLITSVYLGYLAMTKVFFGYVIVVGLFSFGGMYLWQRKERFKLTAYVYLFAFILCLPYLFYTHSVTGKVFYWGSSGGMSLYWMSTPYENEFGDWFSSKSVATKPELTQHREFFDRIGHLSRVQQDDEFKKQAIYNISHHPTKYFVNWTANIGRLLFSYPYSYTQQKLTTYFYFLPNMVMVVLFIFSIYPVVLRWKSMPFEILALLYFGLVAFGGTSLLSAYERQFRPLVPILLLYLCIMYIRVLKIKIRPTSEIMPT